jgi:hypothetical protein
MTAANKDRLEDVNSSGRNLNIIVDFHKIIFIFRSCLKN